MREEIVIVVPALLHPEAQLLTPTQSWASAVRDPFPATVGRGGGWEGMTRGNYKWRAETDMKPNRLQ